MNDACVEFHDVGFSYVPDRPVLEGLSFRMAPGQRVALVGANGSGKTTLLHLIVGLLQPTAGRIKAFGQTRRSEADFHEVRRRAGLLFQDPDDQLFCPTVAEDVAFGPLNLGLPRDRVHTRVAETLASLGLAGYEKRITYKLSWGEKRLVSLAAVLAMRPDVLLLDEPGANLDRPALRRLTDIFAAREEGMIMVSHDLSMARKLCTRAVVLGNGRIVADGPAEKILRNWRLMVAHGVR